MSKELNHPCKETCSGWQQGYEAGLKAASPDTSALRRHAATLVGDVRALASAFEFMVPASVKKVEQALSEKVQHD